MSIEVLLMAIGFMVASYSIVANDAIQTLGTFLSSNRSRPWWLLWRYAIGILYAVLIYGWISNGGDTSYGRLDRIPLPRPFTWIYLVPPLVLLVFKEWSRIPMSTTWVFLGLLAGREIAMSVRLQARPMPDTLRMIRNDGAKVLAGLAVSVLLAVTLPKLSALVSPVPVPAMASVRAGQPVLR